jgi:hypothetical protein
VGAWVTVTGAVTAPPGRILGDRTMAIQDGSAGIFVRLPEGYPLAELPQGRIVRVSGELAAPYGNLEMRPDDATEVIVIGSGGIPDPHRLDTTRVGEDTEGLLVELTGTIEDVEDRESGAIAVIVRDEEGAAQVYLHSTIEVPADDLEPGARIRAMGIVGQRASRTGGTDGHRIWPRGGSDIVRLPSDPQASPRPDDDDEDEDEDDDRDDRGDEDDDRPDRDGPSRVRIRGAKPGRTVTIIGTVTSPVGFIETEGRRVTVQDRTGAILVRYPEGATPAPVGRAIRVSGEVGTWYGGTQLEAESKPRDLGRSRTVPVVLRRPPDAHDEWRLVSVTVRITDVERDGDTWRAEATLGAGGELPIVGLAGSGTSADRLEPGRSARIIGIVKRAHPSASDQRFTVAPRSRADIALGRVVRSAPAGTSDGAAGEGVLESVGGASGTGGALIPTATLATLGDMVGDLVRVGGRVTAADGDLLELDDGTAHVMVRIAGDEDLEPALRVGEVLNLTGTVRPTRGGGPGIVVRSVADIQRAAALRVDEAATPELDGAFLAASTTLPGNGDAATVPDAPAPPPMSIEAMVAVAAFVILSLLVGLAGVRWRGWRTLDRA